MSKPLVPLLLGICLAVLASAALALNDPTQPGSYRAPVGEQHLRLQSIVVGPERKLAVINGQPVAVGEAVAGATVRTIGAQSVTVSRDGRLITLKLADAAVKTKAKR